MQIQSGDRLSLTCTDIDQEGAGMGAWSANATDAPARVHVSGALPGEVITASVTHVSPHNSRGGGRAPLARAHRGRVNEAWATLDAIVVPAPTRRAPACRAFGGCGGCVLQHWDYESQRTWKTARVTAVLHEHPALADVPVPACVASPRRLEYRNSAKLVCAQSASGRLALGAFAPRTHNVVDLRGCRILEPPLDEIATALRDVLEEAAVTAYDERRLIGDLRHVVLRVNHQGQVLATLVTTQRRWPPGRAVAEALRARCAAVIGVVQNINPTRGNVIYGDEEIALAGAATLVERIGNVRLRLSSRSFFQANRGVAALAYAEVAQAAALTGNERVVDAFAGVGGIALTLAPAAREVVGIEAHPAAVADATAAALDNGASNARFVRCDAAEGLRAIDHADVVVLNPPRRGCAPAVLSEVIRLTPRLVAYLSCDPGTLARDLAHLVGQGYRVRSVTPFDMLPHTPHIEALAIAERPIPGQT